MTNTQSSELNPAAETDLDFCLAVMGVDGAGDQLVGTAAGRESSGQDSTGVQMSLAAGSDQIVLDLQLSAADVRSEDPMVLLGDEIDRIVADGWVVVVDAGVSIDSILRSPRLVAAADSGVPGLIVVAEPAGLVPSDVDVVGTTVPVIAVDLADAAAVDNAVAVALGQVLAAMDVVA